MVTPIDIVQLDRSGLGVTEKEIRKALTKPIRIDGAACTYEVLSYYYDEDMKQMVLDIQEK